MKKILHIVPHTHWDREWYMSFEKHRMRLVELLDELIEKMEQDAGYKYFHLDGQTIAVEDYLEIRPQMKERLFKLIRENRIQVGPWYVLQDEYLTSGEANIRNMIEGLKFCKENGFEPVMSGYMPDAFGNISQLPQILKGFGIDNAVFGRGLWTILFDNKLPEGQEPTGKELLWQGADGSIVMGLMFGDWYNNATELPTGDDSLIKEKYEKLVDWLSLTAKTPHMLGMNGCDHQPVQLDLGESIDAANRIFGDAFEVRHSNLKDYVASVRPYSDKFSHISGELNSQFTSGEGILVDTASTHIPIKQKNHRTQNMLYFKAEPMNVMSKLIGDKYRTDELRYAWKKLMQCHPHDSICCCSCDGVTSDIFKRIDMAYDVADYVFKEANSFISSSVNTEDGTDINLIVFNTNPNAAADIADTVFYSEDYLDAKDLSLINSVGDAVNCDIEYLGNKFTYTLPKRTFRKVNYLHSYRIKFPVKSLGIGYSVYSIVNNGKLPDKTSNITVFQNGAENDFVSFVINENGTIDVTEKQTGRTFKGLNRFEDTGDCGNSYNYLQTGDKITRYSGENVSIELVENNSVSATYKITSVMDIPTGLNGENNRSLETIPHVIDTFVTINSGIARIDVKTCFKNNSENHRLRALFDAEIKTDTVFAEGQFDVVKRSIEQWEGWKNPSNTQRMQSFFGLEDENGGLIVAGRGLNEYEILRNGRNTMALTLLRSVGEMGDWGIFPTPDLQLKNTDMELNYSIIPYSAQNKAKAYADAYSFSGEFLSAVQTDKHSGILENHCNFVDVKGEFLEFSAFKKQEEGENFILRICNVSESEQDAEILINDKYFSRLYITNLAENEESEIKTTDNCYKIKIAPKEIKTLIIK